VTNPESDAFVFLGATGDLAYRQIFPALQAMIQHDNFDMPIIGVSRSATGVDALRERARKSIEAHGGVDPRAFATLSARLQYMNGDYHDPETYQKLRQALGDAKRPLYYLAIPPDLFATVAEGLSGSGCHQGARVVVEKPFGRDLASAQALNQTLHHTFAESAISGRPLPRKGTRSEPAVFPIRKFTPGAGLEPSVDPERADNHGRRAPR